MCTCVNCEQALHLHHGYWWASSAVTLSDSSWILQCMHLISERKSLCAREMEQQHRSYIWKQDWWTSPATTSHAPEPRKPGSTVMLGYCPKLGMFLQHEIFIHNQYFVTRKLHHSLEASKKGPEKCGLSQRGYVTNVCPLNPPTSQNFSPITSVILLATDKNEGFTRLEICTIDAKLQSFVNNSLQRQKFVATLTSWACEKGFCLTIQNATCKRICTKSCKHHLENRLQHQNLCISIYMRMSLIFAHCKLLDQVLFETAVIFIL